MSERISRDEVAQLAHLARFRLDDPELDHLTGRLDEILGYIAEWDALDLDDVEPTDHPHPTANVWRADEIGPTLANDALAGAPAAEDGQFVVPTILGEAP